MTTPTTLAADVFSRQYVSRNGTNHTHAEAQAIVTKAGQTPQALDYLRVGEVYHNGTLWFQRMYDA
jgi:hypothetical protein